MVLMVMVLMVVEVVVVVVVAAMGLERPHPCTPTFLYIRLRLKKKKTSAVSDWARDHADRHVFPSSIHHLSLFLPFHVMRSKPRTPSSCDEASKVDQDILPSPDRLHEPSPFLVGFCPSKQGKSVR